MINFAGLARPARKSRVKLPGTAARRSWRLRDQCEALAICAAVHSSSPAIPAAGRSGRQASLPDQAAWQAALDPAWQIQLRSRSRPIPRRIATEGRFGAASSGGGPWACFGDTVIRQPTIAGQFQLSASTH